MSSHESLQRTIRLLRRVTDDQYEEAIRGVVRPDGFGILSDRLIPGLSTGQVYRERLVTILHNMYELRPEMFARNENELVQLNLTLERTA